MSSYKGSGGAGGDELSKRPDEKQISMSPNAASPSLDNAEQLSHSPIDIVNPTQKLPYSEINFVGTYMAALLGCVGCFGTYIMPVTSLPIITKLLGPSPNSTWIALAWTLLSAVSFTLTGRLSDIFGRRWFFAGSSAAAVVGSIIGCTAQHTDTLIAASVFLGIASAGQLSTNYSVGELVPVRHRFAANGFIFLASLPTAALGPYIARIFIEKTSPSWRGIYYLGIGIHGASTACWLLFYHPPNFQKLHRNRTKMDELREMDFGGIFLFLAGSVLFLLGLSWGGQLYPWTSAKVLTTLIIGFITLLGFVLYEIFMPLKRPLIPMHLFNYGFTTFNILSAVGGVVYYSMSVLFPTMVATLFETDVIKGGLVSCAVGGGVCAGQFLASWLTLPGGHIRAKLVFVSSGMTAFLAGLAGATDSETTATALAVMAGVMVGFLETVVSTAVTIVIDDQSEIGTGAGVYGSIRAAAGVLATAIYISILQNKVSLYTKTIVVPSLVKAGLPVTSVASLLAALGAGETAAITEIPGVTPSILQVAAATLHEAYAHSFKVVYFATIAFGALSLIACCFVPDIGAKMSGDIIRRLESHNDVEDLVGNMAKNDKT